MNGFRNRLEYLTQRILNKIGNILFRGKSPFTKHNTLLFLKIDSIGDYVLVRNFIQTVKESDKYKNYRMVLCGNLLWKDLAVSYDAPYLEKFIWIDYVRIQKEALYRFVKYLTIFISGFEVLIHPTYSRDMVGDNIVKYSGAKYRIGFDGDRMNYPTGISRSDYDKSYTQLIKSKLSNPFEFNRNKEFFQELLGMEIFLDSPTISVNGSGEEYIVICPGASKDFKRWAIINFAKLCNLLTEVYKGDFIICGSSSDSILASVIIQNSNAKFIDYTGKKKLNQLVEIFEKAKLIITNDSGPFHIANAMNKKVVAISNGYHYGRFSPYPQEMKLNGLYIFPPEVSNMLNDSKNFNKLYNLESPWDMNTILPEDVYSLILKTYFR